MIPMRKLMDKIKKNNKGFTLVELIVVIAVLAIITVVVAPQYIKYVEKSKIGVDENAIGEIAHIAEIQWVELNAADTVDGQVVLTVDCDDTKATVEGKSGTGADELAESVTEILGTYKFKSDTYAGKTVDITISKDGIADWDSLNS